MLWRRQFILGEPLISSLDSLLYLDFSWQKTWIFECIRKIYKYIIDKYNVFHANIVNKIFICLLMSDVQNILGIVRIFVNFN